MLFKKLVYPCLILFSLSLTGPAMAKEKSGGIIGSVMVSGDKTSKSMKKIGQIEPKKPMNKKPKVAPPPRPNKKPVNKPKAASALKVSPNNAFFSSVTVFGF